MPIKIWLDDMRPAPEGWIWVQTPYAALYYLDNEEVDELSLDHDLGLHFVDGTEITGYAVLQTLEERQHFWEGYHIPEVITVHSANGGARRKMELAIDAIERRRNQ